MCEWPECNFVNDSSVFVVAPFSTHPELRLATGLCDYQRPLAAAQSGHWRLLMPPVLHSSVTERVTTKSEVGGANHRRSDVLKVRRIKLAKANDVCKQYFVQNFGLVKVTGWRVTIPRVRVRNDISRSRFQRYRVRNDTCVTDSSKD